MFPNVWAPLKKSQQTKTPEKKHIKQSKSRIHQYGNEFLEKYQLTILFIKSIPFFLMIANICCKNNKNNNDKYYFDGFFFKKISKPFITEHKNSHWHRNIMFHPTNGYFDLSKAAIVRFRFST